MIRRKHLMLLLTLMMTLCACSNRGMSADIYERIYEQYNQLNSYHSKIRMTVTSNKTTKTYVMNQYYKAPDRYKIEILEPEDIRGLVTVYSGSNVTTIYPEIQGKFTLMNFTPIDKSYIFISDFFETYYKSEQTAVFMVNKAESRQTVLEANIPGSNIYRFNQKMWIDNNTLRPLKMEIYDIKKKAVISITYDEVELNTELEDKIFELGG